MNVGIGLIQMESSVGDKKVNLEKAKLFIKEAIDNGADIIVLPELFLVGYALEKIGESLSYLAETINGPTVKELLHISKREGVVIVAPIPEIRETPGVVYNSAIVIGDDGKVLGSYAKTHLWVLEKKYFRAGNSYPVFKTSYGTIGVMICYDAGFPEVARILTLKGAEIILMPSAWRIQDFDLWDVNTRARALENLVYLAAVNMVGERNGKPYFFGNSRIVNPRGHIVKEGKLNNEEIIVHKLNLNELVEFRKQLSYLRDRRPEIYHYILK